VYLSIPIAEGALTVASAVMFKRGKWKIKTV
jgi:hypothetical protein